MRRRGVFALLSVIGVGCGAFSGDPPAKTDDAVDAGTGASDDAGGDPSPSGDARAPDAAAVDGGLACGTTTCTNGTSCCHSTKSTDPTCSASCAGGVSFACSMTSDCEAGQVCCLQGAAATCESSCPNAGAQVCGSNDDCMGTGAGCRTGNCKHTPGNQEFPIRTCTSGTRFFDINGGWSCSL